MLEVIGTIKRKICWGYYLDCSDKVYKIHISEHLEDEAIGFLATGEFADGYGKPSKTDAWIRPDSLRFIATSSQRIKKG